MSAVKMDRFEFQSEVKQLLNILVYSLYKNKEVFVRELVSNAVDALNKVRFEILTGRETEDKDAELRIDISFNQSQRKLIVEDNGIGMLREELIENIGTIAHSGTVDFLKNLSEADSQEQDTLDLIGKFGVGFYSSFMVAEEIHIYTKSYKQNSQGYVWKSKGDTEYTIEESPKKQRGTRIEIFLREDEKEFLEKYRIQNILTKYSKFVPFPIYLEKEKLEVVDAIWTQPKSSLKEKDYFEFYRFFENIQEDPETYIHLSSDAPVQFNAIFYIPKTSFEKFGFFKEELGVDLYSRKVLIQKSSKDIMPEYLRFIKGVVDSEEIPLNISRETIQSNIKIDKIRKHILKKLLGHIEKIKEKDRDKYLRIWGNFSRNLKEGIASDVENKDKLSPLLLFRSSKKARDEWIDLKEYRERMGKDQKEIYYITGLDLDALAKNPALEAFQQKDLEVLYLTDPLDEFVVEHLREFDGTPFRMAESADIKLDTKTEADKKKDAAAQQDEEGFIAYLKKLYGDRVADVRLSRRLVESPCLLVHPATGPSVHMERILKMANKDYQFTKKVLEINPDNELIKEMIHFHSAEPQSLELEILALQMLDNMLLREGVLEDIDHIVPRIQQIMLQAAKKIRPVQKAKPKSEPKAKAVSQTKIKTKAGPAAQAKAKTKTKDTKKAKQ